MRRALLVAAVLALAPAQADAQVLETLTVDAASSSVTTGTVKLTKGKRYTLEVAGRASLVGPEGVGQHFDAIWCIEKINTTGSQDGCEGQNRTRSTNALMIGTGPDSRWATVDRFDDPSAPYLDTADVPAYREDHVYTVTFYAPTDDPLRAGGLYATGCAGCQTTVNGTFTIKVIDGAAPPAAPTPSTPTPRPPVTTPPDPVTIIERLVPGQFCTGTASPIRAIQAQAPAPCQSTSPPVFLTKAQRRLQAKRDAIQVVKYCAVVSEIGRSAAFLTMCVLRAITAMEHALEAIDAGPELATRAASPARAAARTRLPAAARTAARHAEDAARDVRTVVDAIANATQRFRAAVAARDVREAATWQATLRAYAGLYAQVLRADDDAQRVLATALRRAKLKARPARRVAADARRLFSLRGAPRQVVAHLRSRGWSTSQIAAAFASLRRAVPARPLRLGDPPSGAGPAQQVDRVYASLTPADAYLLVVSLGRSGHLDSASAARLAAQLGTIATTCEPGRRAVLIRALVDDATRSSGRNRLAVVAAYGLVGSRC